MKYTIYEKETEHVNKSFSILFPLFTNNSGVDHLGKKFSILDISFDTHFYVEIFGAGSMRWSFRILGFGVLTYWRVKNG